MNWLAILASALKLAAALTKHLSERLLLAAGAEKGRAERDRAHARAAAEAERAMRDIAERPASRHEVIERLEEGRG